MIEENNWEGGLSRKQRLVLFSPFFIKWSIDSIAMGWCSVTGLRHLFLVLLYFSFCRFFCWQKQLVRKKDGVKKTGGNDLLVLGYAKSKYARIKTLAHGDRLLNRVYLNANNKAAILYHQGRFVLFQ